MAYTVALDLGTTSNRCIIFDENGRIVSKGQKEFTQIMPQPGWVEHDALEILSGVHEVIDLALSSLNCDVSTARARIKALGITNQRETAVVWEKTSGKPLYNALVWMDTRTSEICQELEKEGGKDRFRSKTGLPIATYFSAAKWKWLIDNVPAVSTAIESGTALFGTIDSWIVWHLTGVHATDVSNASRTQLMNLQTLQWDNDLLKVFSIPRVCLPKICPSSTKIGFGVVKKGPLAGVPLTGVLGDQQAALFGQTCFDLGDVKNTYGTGCFMLFNTGTEIIHSTHGLLTTVGYQIGEGSPVVYCLEGSVAIAGALIQWLRDNLELIKNAAEVESAAAKVDDNGGVYIVPAFSGLYAPHWRMDARGVIAGLTRFANRSHLCRASLEASAFQTRDVLEAMIADTKKADGKGVELSEMRVDGGMTSNKLLMQFQADMLNAPIMRPVVAETTALGAAYAAGLAVGVWKDTNELRKKWVLDATFQPKMKEEERRVLYEQWKKAVQRTLNWVDESKL